MRYMTMQFLTWGTVAGAIGSALLLGALDSSPLQARPGAVTRLELPALPRARPQADRPGHTGARRVAASTPSQ
jgi:hypothetical protein